MNPVYRPTSFGRSIESTTPAEMFFGFRGRIPRRAWWLYGVLAMAGLSTIATVLLRIAGLGAVATDTLVNLLLVWPAAAVSVKRWHDRDKSGWWVLVALLPLIGWLWVLIENGLRRGTPGANRFGPPPAGRAHG